MYASLWKFDGNPDELLASYDEAVAQVPREAMRLHLCLRTDDGVLLVDTCPTEEQVRALVGDPEFRRLLADHGLPEPEPVTVVAVHRAFVSGQAVE